jgi:hypothetical protein
MKGIERRHCSFQVHFGSFWGFHLKGFAIDLGALETDSWVFPTIFYMVELNFIIGTLLRGNQLVD